MKVIFMGTPDFAVGALEAIIEAGHEVTLVVTQPDREKGRGKEVQFPPVKEAAINHHLPVFQPGRIKTPEAIAELKKWEADIFVVAAFGQILSKEILDMPRLGCINIHASLLPKYRGAAPIQWAVMNGDKESGVTIQQMNEGVDTGDIILQKTIGLDVKETGESLFDRLAVLGAEAVVEALAQFENGTVTRRRQNEEESSHVGMLTKEMGQLDFNKDAVTLERLIRGLNSWPSAYTKLNGKTLKIWDADAVESEEKLQPGTVFAVRKDSFCIACGEGTLVIYEVQLEGKKRMPVKDFLLGYPLEEGCLLG